MTLPFDAGDDVVTALQYDDTSVAADLAAWCGGDLVPSDEQDTAPVIWVPTAKGPRPAALGDWIVRRAAGDYYPCDARTFRALHAPLT